MRQANGAVVADRAVVFGRTAASSHRTIILYIIKYYYIIIIASSARAEGTQINCPNCPDCSASTRCPHHKRRPACFWGKENKPVRCQTLTIKEFWWYPLCDSKLTEFNRPLQANPPQNGSVFWNLFKLKNYPPPISGAQHAVGTIWRVINRRVLKNCRKRCVEFSPIYPNFVGFHPLKNATRLWNSIAPHTPI